MRAVGRLDLMGMVDDLLKKGGKKSLVILRQHLVSPFETSSDVFRVVRAVVRAVDWVVEKLRPLVRIRRLVAGSMNDGD